MGRRIEGVQYEKLDRVLPYLSEGAFGHVSKVSYVTDGGVLVPPEKGPGRYSLPNARKRSEFYNDTRPHNTDNLHGVHKKRKRPLRSIRRS